jgi:hypothetical protein
MPEIILQACIHIPREPHSADILGTINSHFENLEGFKTMKRILDEAENVDG